MAADRAAAEAALNGFHSTLNRRTVPGKAGLVRRLCPVQTRGGGGPEGGARALCCELVDMSAGSRAIRTTTARSLTEPRRRESEGVKTDRTRPTPTARVRASRRRVVLEVLRLGASPNYAPEDGPSQLKIATSVLTRAKTRDEAGVVFEEPRRYLARMPSPKPETCAALDATRATLVADDPEARFFETLDLETLETETSPTPPTREARGTDVVRNARFVLENATTTHSRTAATAEAGKKKRGAPSTADGVGREFFGVPFFGAVAFAAWRRASRRRRGKPLSR